MPTYNCPTYLYKYYAFNGLEKTLVAQSFKLSRPSSFNDPFDLLIEEALGMDMGDFLEGMKTDFQNFVEGEMDYAKLPDGPNGVKLRMINKALKKATPEMRQKLREEMLGTPLDSMYDVEYMKERTDEVLAFVRASFQNEAVFCTTTDPDNLLMWAHYADNHRGAVVCYKPSIEKNSVLLISKLVTYSAVRPLLYRAPQDLIRRGLTMSIEDSVNEMLHGLIYTKSPEWSYENEYRLTIPFMIKDGMPFATQKFHPGELSRIYLGCRMPDEQKERVIQLARAINPEVEIYQATLKKRDYALDYVPV